ncbi:hypothetical protein CONPUDRAFT_38927, partial [Coniophora puteana RWD-64-598 SS2]
DADYSSEQLSSLVISKNKVYEHKTLHVNYTTYDLRRKQDTINPRSRADIMVMSQDSPSDAGVHPYWYARVTYIFHLKVRFRQEDPTSLRRINIVLVRWLHRNSRYQSIFAARRLPRVSFHPLSSSECWDFIDPSTIVRGIHLIPAFKRGRS